MAIGCLTACSGTDDSVSAEQNNEEHLQASDNFVVEQNEEKLAQSSESTTVERNDEDFVRTPFTHKNVAAGFSSYLGLSSSKSELNPRRINEDRFLGKEVQRGRIESQRAGK